jgi:hypothetical protein
MFRGRGVYNVGLDRGWVLIFIWFGAGAPCILLLDVGG